MGGSGVEKSLGEAGKENMVDGSFLVTVISGMVDFM